MQTPFFLPLLIRVYPSAMLIAVRSTLEIIGRIPASATASMRMLLGKQKTNSTPSCFRMFATRDFPSTVIPLYMVYT